MNPLIQTQHRNGAEGTSFRAPLTLATRADLLGLTLVHISRLMPRRRRSALTRTDRDLIAIGDIEALAKACDFDPSYPHPSENPQSRRQRWS